MYCCAILSECLFNFRFKRNIYYETPCIHNMAVQYMQNKSTICSIQTEIKSISWQTSDLCVCSKYSMCEEFPRSHFQSSWCDIITPNFIFIIVNILGQQDANYFLSLHIYAIFCFILFLDVF